MRNIAALFLILASLFLILSSNVLASGSSTDAEVRYYEKKHGLDIHTGERIWTNFVVHVRRYDPEQFGGKCAKAHKAGGCAIRRPSPPGALLDGECWIMVPEWATDRRALEIRGHELGHCERGSWHK